MKSNFEKFLDIDFKISNTVWKMLADGNRDEVFVKGSPGRFFVLIKAKCYLLVDNSNQSCKISSYSKYLLFLQKYALL